MNSRYLAYFIGGPEDMTKWVITEPLPMVQIPELAEIQPFDHATSPPTEKVNHRVHRYELMHHHRSLSENADVFIYVHQGDNQ